MWRKYAWLSLILCFIFLPLVHGVANAGIHRNPDFISDDASQTGHRDYESSPQLISGANVLYGVDVSEWQYTIDWDALNAGTSFAIIRSSYGRNSVDAYITRNQSEARRVGILHGYYHYSYPQYNDPVPEAQNFLSRVGALQPGEILCLDYEEDCAKDPVAWSLDFMNYVYQQTGVRSLMYINLSMEQSYDWSPIINAGYGLWLARYDGIASFSTPTGLQWPFMAFKQYTDSGSVGGLNAVDMDIFNGGVSQFRAYGLQPAPLVLQITFPTTDTSYSTSAGYLTIGGTVSDGLNVNSITWSNDRGGNGSCSATSNWSISNIALFPGQNLITITATDAWGRQVAKTLTVTYNTLSVLQGTVTLQDFRGSAASVPVTAELRLHGGSTTTTVVSLDRNGNFTIPNVVPGTYDIAFKASHWLRKVVSGVVVDGNISGLSVSLINGDVNGDNAENMRDYTEMKAAWGSNPYQRGVLSPASPTWNVNADLNGDSRVNTGDYAILMKNWGLTGDK